MKQGWTSDIERITHERNFLLAKLPLLQIVHAFALIISWMRFFISISFRHFCKQLR